MPHFLTHAADGKNELVHDEARVDASPMDRNPFRLGQAVQSSSQFGTLQGRIGQILASGADVQASLNQFLKLIHHLRQERSRSVDGDVRLGILQSTLQVGGDNDSPGILTKEHTQIRTDLGWVCIHRRNTGHVGATVHQTGYLASNVANAIVKHSD